MILTEDLRRVLLAVPASRADKAASIGAIADAAGLDPTYVSDRMSSLMEVDWVMSYGTGRNRHFSRTPEGDKALRGEV